MGFQLECSIVMFLSGGVDVHAHIAMTVWEPWEQVLLSFWLSR